MQNDSQDGGLPLNRGRSQTVDNISSSRGTSRPKSRASPAPGTSSVDPKGWGFEFVDQQPPEDPIERETKATHSDFNKMLVSGISLSLKSSY
jgi:hypothetical protein